jgi:tRNA threonylcarbamoyl adenosine modification protein YeaZ
LRRLAIETAADTCSVALFEGDDLIAYRHEVVGRGHAERLVPMISELPDRGRADDILVDCGPGSFTGVRVGLAAARALGFAWGASVHGYSSLPLIAASAFRQEAGLDRIAVAIIGGHGEYFVQLFGSGPVTVLAPLASLKPDAAARQCGALPIAGSGGPALQAEGATGRLIQVELDARETAWLPRDLAGLPPSPIYGRAPDARPPA